MAAAAGTIADFVDLDPDDIRSVLLPDAAQPPPVAAARGVEAAAQQAQAALRRAQAQLEGGGGWQAEAGAALMAAIDGLRDHCSRCAVCFAR